MSDIAINPVGDTAIILNISNWTFRGPGVNGMEWVLKALDR